VLKITLLTIIVGYTTAWAAFVALGLFIAVQWLFEGGWR
jgi:hypothetical protein